LAGDLRIGEIVTFTCQPDDDIHEALDTMASKQVRRLPVVDKNDIPRGILSMDDIITHGDLNKWEGCCELSAEEIVRSLKRLYGPQFPVIRIKAVGAQLDPTAPSSPS
jgi:predicted transcriptional regulator